MKRKKRNSKHFKEKTLQTTTTAPPTLPDQPLVTSPPTVEADKAVSQTGRKVLVVVAWAQHKIAVDGQYTQSIQQCHLLSHCLVGSAELVQHRPVQTVVDCVKGKALGTPFGLKQESGANKEAQEKTSIKEMVGWSAWLLHCGALDNDAEEIFQHRDLLKQLGLKWLKQF